VVVVLDLAEIFAGDSEIVGQVVVAGGYDEFTGAMSDWAAEAVQSVDAEVSVGALDALDVFILVNVELVVLGYLTVILEGFVAIGLLVGA